eukprot:SAG25_NODE_13713_length_264_cov_0.145455_1_plen_56_part_01
MFHLARAAAGLLQRACAAGYADRRATGGRRTRARRFGSRRGLAYQLAGARARAGHV